MALTLADKPGRGQTALLTGASSGIGRELAALFAADGFDLVLTARRDQLLQDLARELRADHGVAVHPLALDLGRPGAARELFDRTAALGVPVDVLVNNAGFACFGLFQDNEPGALDEMLELNVVALTDLTRLFLPAMLARRRGRVLHVASTAAFLPGPLMASYYASKAYVLSFSEALANELHGTGVHVTCLCPGVTASGFQARAGFAPPANARATPMSARAVAASGYRALLRGDRLHIPGAANRLLVFATRFLPRAVVTAAVRRLQDTRLRPEA